VAALPLIRSNAARLPEIQAHAVLGVALAAGCLSALGRRGSVPPWWPVVLLAPLSFAGTVRWIDDAVPSVLGAVCWFATPLAGSAVLLAWPDRDRPRLLARHPALVCIGAPLYVALAVVLVMGTGASAGVLPLQYWGPNRREELFTPQQLLGPSQASTTAPALATWIVLVLGLAWFVAVVLVRRWRRAVGVEHRLLGPMAWAALAWAICQTASAVVAWPVETWVEGFDPRDWQPVYLALAIVGLAAITAAYVWLELVRPRLARAPDGSLALERARAGLDAVVRSTLGDPTAAVVLADAQGGWMRADGRRADDQPAPSRFRALVTTDGAPIAALDCDVAFAVDRELVALAAGLAGRSMETDRLAALTRSRAADVRAATERLRNAEESSRAEFSISVRGGPTAHLISAEDAIATGSLHRAHDELRAAVAELRTLSQQLTPAALAGSDLRRSLTELAGRSPSGVIVGDVTTRPVDPVVATTIHLLVADATRRARGVVAVEVRSDGSDLVVTIGGVDHEPSELVRARLDALSATSTFESTRLDVRFAPRDDEPNP
jgi:hypothetical protein